MLQIYLYKSSTITRSLGKVSLEILVANLATNFQNLVAKVKNGREQNLDRIPDRTPDRIGLQIGSDSGSDRIPDRIGLVSSLFGD